jgi:hypothetical protein
MPAMLANFRKDFSVERTEGVFPASNALRYGSNPA